MPPGERRRLFTMERNYAPVTPEEADVVGLIAYSILAAMTRLAKDGDQAPSFEVHAEHARMSARAFTIFTQVETWCVHRGVDLTAAGQNYEGLFDDLDARTRPTTWYERSVKTYVTLGIISDFLKEIAAPRGLFDEADWDLGQSAWERTHLAPVIASDEQLSARLSLWARRVAGEVLGLMRATLFMHPHLVDSPETGDAVIERITARHGERMADINLRS